MIRHAAITQALGHRDAAPGDQPLALIAHTTKGKGISFMEGDNNWHYKTPNDQDLAKALAELNTQ